MKLTISFILVLTLLSGCIIENLDIQRPTPVPQTIKPNYPSKTPDIEQVPVTTNNKQEIALLSGKKLTYELPKGWKLVDSGSTNKAAVSPESKRFAMNIVITSEETDLTLKEYATLSAYAIPKMTPNWSHVITAENSPIAGRDCITVTGDLKLDNIKAYQTNYYVKVDKEMVIIIVTYGGTDLEDMFLTMIEFTTSIEIR